MCIESNDSFNIPRTIPTTIGTERGIRETQKDNPQKKEVYTTSGEIMLTPTANVQTLQAGCFLQHNFFYSTLSVNVPSKDTRVYRNWYVACRSKAPWCFAHCKAAWVPGRTPGS